MAYGPKQPLVIETITVAPPGPNEIRVKIISNALCHTDLYTLDGLDPEGLFPCILGHEAIGVIESVGSQVSNLKVGQTVIPCYTPQCKNCLFCDNQNTNLCPKIRAYQGKGIMPDGTTRFTGPKGPIYHFMGCSTLTEYTVIHELSAAVVHNGGNPNELCMLGCGVSTGWVTYSNSGSSLQHLQGGRRNLSPGLWARSSGS